MGIAGLLSVGEAAAYLGLSKHTLYGWVSQKRIPYTKMGRRTLFQREELDRMIASNTVEARAA